MNARMSHSTRRLLPFARCAALALLSAGILAGCNFLPDPLPDNTRHYLLDAGTAPAAGDATASVRIGLRPVELPAYLRERTIVVRTGENELSLAPDARWAEPLEAGITRVLREQLAGGARVMGYPFSAQLARDFDVTVRIVNAEGTRDGVRFVAVFELLRVGDQPEVVVRREFRHAGKAWNGDHGRLAGELSGAVAELAREILAAVPRE